MNLKFWKHKQTNAVIKPECYNKLPEGHRSSYAPTNEEPTHRVNEDETFGVLSSLIAIGAMESSFGSSPSVDFGSSSDSSSSSSDFGGFSGGDGGGGGASGDW